MRIISRRWKKPPPVSSVRPDMNDGRRLMKIYYVVEVLERLLRVQASYRENNKRKWTSRGTAFWKRKEEEEMRKGVNARMEMRSLTLEMTNWIPYILSQDMIWVEPLDPEELAELFEAFVPPETEMLRDAINKGLRLALPKSNLTAIAPVLLGMVKAGLPCPPAYQILGEFAVRKLGKDDLGGMASFAWAMAEAAEKAPPESFQALMTGMVSYVGDVPPEQLRIFAWSCAEVGLKSPELFGQAPAEATPDAVRGVREALARLPFQPGGSQLHGEPTPVVAVEGALSPEAAEALLRLADEGDLWRPSARRGTEAVSGRPWSASLDRLEHRFSPTANAVRLWVADALGVPCERVEALRLLRYREGEAPGPAHADARPADDPSLWLSGQRVAAALIHLADLPESAGGEVTFPELEDLRVQPRAGVALLWPTTDYDGRAEPRMARSAMPVVGEGLVRYAVATWVRSGPAPGWGGAEPA